MRFLITPSLIFAFALAAAPFPARAADIDNLKLATVIHGPQVAKEDLAGKVVWVELWGVG